VNTALNVKDYACGKVRRRLDSYLAGELSVDLSHEILEHLDRCPDCAAELKARENLRAAVRRLAAVTPEPREGFEAEVRARVARTPVPVFSRPATLLLAASLVAAAGAGTLFFLASVAPAPDLAAARDAKAFLFAALNHKNCTLRFGKWAMIAAPPAKELGPKLEPELQAAVAKAAGELPGYVPVVAHVCNHAGEKVFHLIYRRSGDTKPEDLVSVFATRPGSSIARDVRLAGLVNGGRMDGLAVVGTTAADGNLLFLVTNHSDDDAMRFGKAVLPAVASAFVAR
jgi:anti-sigma factor RsiW